MNNFRAEGRKELKDDCVKYEMENFKQESPDFIDAVGQRLLGRTSSSAAPDSPPLVPFVLLLSFILLYLSHVNTNWGQTRIFHLAIIIATTYCLAPEKSRVRTPKFYYL